ncbi:MAG: glycosyltransferase family 4 protein [Pseudomonadota bacterium]
MNKILMVGTDVSTMGGIASVIRDYIDCGLMERLSISYLPTHRDGSKLDKALFFLRQFPKALKQMLGVDIVHIHTSHGWSYRRLFNIIVGARVLRRKIVLHVHGSEFDEYYANASKIEKSLVRKGLELADTVIALSQDWKEKLAKIAPSAQVIVVRNSVDRNKYRPKSPRLLKSPATALFLGRLGERKGVYDLLDAIGRLEGQPMHFVIAGDGDIDKVKQVVESRGWQDQVSVPGWVGPTQKSDLLSLADVYVLPSYHEGLPISILEAMAAGLPVVSTPVGGIPEAVISGENGILVPPGDSEALASALTKCVEDSQIWSSMSKRSLELTDERFAMELVECRLEELYQSL